MKFANSYKFFVNAGADGIKEKLQKLVGMDSCHTTIRLDGELSCDVSIEELKEILDSQDSRIKSLREYVGGGDLKKDILEVLSAVGEAAVKYEQIDRDVVKEQTDSRIFRQRERQRENAEDRKIQKEAAKEAKSEK